MNTSSTNQPSTSNQNQTHGSSSTKSQYPSELNPTVRTPIQPGSPQPTSTTQPAAQPRQSAPGSAAGRPSGTQGSSTPSSRSGQVRPTSFDGNHQPEKSKLGMYITIGVIAVLGILLVYQIISKGRANAEVRALRQQVEELQSQAELSQGATQSNVATTQSPSAYYPAMYNNNIRQQVGQLLTAASDTKIEAVYLRGNGGSGQNAELAIFETSDPTRLDSSTRPSASKLFESSKIPVGQPFAVKLDRPYTLKAGKQYLIAVRPSTTDARANVGFSNGDTLGGSMWVYAIQVDSLGKPLTETPSWQNIPGSDLIIDFKTQQ